MQNQAIVREIATKAPNDSLIAHLEKLLEYARTGDLEGMAYSAQWKGMNFSEHAECINMEYTRTYIGSLEILRDRIAGEYFMQENA